MIELARTLQWLSCVEHPGRSPYMEMAANPAFWPASVYGDQALALINRRDLAEKLLQGILDAHPDLAPHSRLGLPTRRTADGKES